MGVMKKDIPHENNIRKPHKQFLALEKLKQGSSEF